MRHQSYPINILVIEPSQNGKSTFIKKLCSAASVKGQDEPPVGEGTFSCTRDAAVYPISISTTTYRFVDTLTNKEIEILEDEGRILQHDIWKQKRARVEPVDPEAPEVHLRLIDTPGLDDSRGNDAENIQNVFEKLN